MLIEPFVEEFLMRALMTVRLLCRLPLWFVVALPTVLFGVGHSAGGIGQIVGTSTVGLVFTFVFVWTNSLPTALLAHALNNILTAFLTLGAIKASMTTPIQLIVGIVGVALDWFSSIHNL